MRPLAPWGIAVLAASVLAATLTGCGSTPKAVTAVGTVIDPSRTVAIPALIVPVVNLDAGFTQTGSATPTTNPVASRYQIGTTEQLASLKVRVGDTVVKGQPLATLNRAALTAQLAAAKADQAVSNSQVGVLTSAIADTYTKADDVDTAKAKVRAAIATLTKTLASLKKAKPVLTQTRADLAAKLDQAESLLAHYPPTPPPGLPSKEQVKASITQLKAGITQLDAKLAQINKAVPQLVAGLAKARAGLAKLDAAATKISDARAQLRDLRELAGIAATSASIPVALALVQLDLATITAPVDGVVTSVANPGERLAPGAAAATIRQAGPSKVTAWLSPSQLAKVCLGDSARLVGDWMTQGEGVDATVTRIAPSADFPPSATATDETHLTRAVQVELTATATLPAGVPVDISISGCHPTAGPSEQDR